MVIKLNCMYLRFFEMKYFLLIILKANNFVLKITVICIICFKEKWNWILRCYSYNKFNRDKMMIRTWNCDSKHWPLLNINTYGLFDFRWELLACFQLPMKMTLHVKINKLYSSDCSILKTLSNYSIYQGEHLEVL